MITRAEVEKLGARHGVEPTMLSLYLAVPPRPALLAPPRQTALLGYDGGRAPAGTATVISR